MDIDGQLKPESEFVKPTTVTSSSSVGGGGAVVIQVTLPSAPYPVELPSAVPLTDAERDAQKEQEQAQLEDEMRKRRERVKAWQQAKAEEVS